MKTSDQTFHVSYDSLKYQLVALSMGLVDDSEVDWYSLKQPVVLPSGMRS